jgi:hypothetical protein
MVPDFVRDHIGLGEVACGAVARPKLVEEARVEIDAVVRRAVEGAHCGLRGAAAGIAGAAVEGEGGGPVALAALAEDRGPGIFGGSQDLAGEAADRILLAGPQRLRAAGARRRRPRGGACCWPWGATTPLPPPEPAIIEKAQ